MKHWFHREKVEADVPSDLFVIVGLGNPGRQYQETRHSVGFMVVEELAHRHHLRFTSSKHRADIAKGEIGGHQVLLALPLTFMNESGDAVARLLRYYRVPVDRLLVVSDDLDLPFGTIRLRPSGSAAGQKGLQSIIDRLGTNEFCRLRVGIGRPRGDTVSYVLRPFDPAERAALDAVLAAASEAIVAVLTQGVRGAMNEFNRDWLPSSAESGDRA